MLKKTIRITAFALLGATLTACQNGKSTILDAEQPSVCKKLDREMNYQINVNNDDRVTTRQELRKRYQQMKHENGCQ